MKKMNNKGFSLVELIIVIAIMAILIVVLAPQYLKYVEKSRNSTDVTNATEIVTALQVYAADPDAATPVPSSAFTVKVEANANATVPPGFATDALKEAGLLDASDALTTRCVSRSKWNTYSIVATPDGKGGLDFTYTAAGATNSTADFTNAMTGVKATSSGSGE